MNKKNRSWLIPTGLIVLALVPALAGGVRVSQLAGGAEVTPENARFFTMPVPVLLHIPAAIIYSILGAFQFAPSFRKRNRSWHRAAGKILIPAGFVVALSGLWMTFAYPWPYGDGVGVYLERIVAGSLMTISLLLGVNSIRRRKFGEHGEWMIRAYAIGMGAGTQVLTHLPWFLLSDVKPGESARAILMGGGWLINMVFAEWVIRKPTIKLKPAMAAAK